MMSGWHHSSLCVCVRACVRACVSLLFLIQFWLNFPTRDRTHYTDAHSEMPHAMYTSGPASEDSGIDETPMTMTNSGDNDVRFDHNPTARREA